MKEIYCTNTVFRQHAINSFFPEIIHSIFYYFSFPRNVYCEAYKEEFVRKANKLCHSSSNHQLHGVLRGRFSII